MLEAHTKILLVEDNDLDVLVIKRLLRRLKLDFPIVRARNGEEALPILRSGVVNNSLPPFIMIVDINMPRMNGFELLDQVVDDPQLANVPIYMLSSSASEKDINKAAQYRIRGYKVKPITEPVLMEMLNDEQAA